LGTKRENILEEVEGGWRRKHGAAARQAIGKGGYSLDFFVLSVGEQGSPGLVEIAQSKEQMEPGGVLGQAAVADSGVAPQLLDDAKGKFDFGPQGRLVPVGTPLFATEGRAAMSFVLDEVEYPGLAAVGFQQIIGVTGVSPMTSS